MAIELRKLGCKVLQQQNIKVYYETEEVGDYFADLLVDDLVIVELKAAESLCEEHEAQLIVTIQLVLFCHKVSKTQSYTNKNNDWVFCSANQLKIEPQNSVISNPRRGEKSGCSRAVPDFSPAKRDRNDTWFFYVLSTFDFM